MASVESRNKSSLIRPLKYEITGFAWHISYIVLKSTMSNRYSPHSLPRYPTVQTLSKVVRNMNLFSIDYAFRPRLRSRLTLGGLTFPRNPWVCGDKVSHLVSRYLYHHPLFHFVHQSLRSDFNLPWNAPLPDAKPAGSTNPKLRYNA